jgi:protoporphyrinogen/coproporphyrinogen III oxidase
MTDIEGRGGEGGAERRDVVVVGAGVSGLATAWHLRDRDVLVLEESDRLGGRIRSVRREDAWLNFGAHVYGGDGTATDRLLRGLGVTALPLPGKLAALAYAGRIVTSAVETYPFRLPLPARSRTALVRAGLKLRYDVARYDRMLRPRPGESAAERQTRIINFMDDESFTERIGKLPPDVDAMFRCTLTRSSGEPEELAAGYGVGYFHLVWDRSSGLSRGIIGGPSTIVDKLADVAKDVRTGARVTSVEDTGDGVLVRYEEGGDVRSVTAAAAVLAVPAPVAAALAPGLPGETAAALREIRYGHYAVGAFLVEGKAPLPWDGLYAVATPGRSFGMAYNIGNVQLQPGAPRPAHGSVMVYAAADLGAQLLQDDDEKIAQRFTDDLCAVFPGVAPRIEDVVIQRWPRGIPFAHVGRGRLQAPLTRPLGRLHLVGDYLGTRYVEMCAGNAEAAALRIRDQLPPRGFTA